jgi:hypothetical protein
MAGHILRTPVFADKYARCICVRSSRWHEWHWREHIPRVKELLPAGWSAGWVSRTSIYVLNSDGGIRMCWSVWQLQCVIGKGEVLVHAVKAYVGIKVQLHTFLTLIMGDEWLASRSGHFTTRETAAGIHLNRILRGFHSWSGRIGEAKNF